MANHVILETPQVRTLSLFGLPLMGIKDLFWIWDLGHKLVNNYSILIMFQEGFKDQLSKNNLSYLSTRHSILGSDCMTLILMLLIALIALLVLFDCFLER